MPRTFSEQIDVLGKFFEQTDNAVFWNRLTIKSNYFFSQHDYNLTTLYSPSLLLKWFAQTKLDTVQNENVLTNGSWVIECQYVNMLSTLNQILYIELYIKCNVLFCFSNSVLCCGVIYFLVNLLTLLCLIPFYLSEHLCNVGQFDIWLQTHKTCTVGTFSTEDSPRERRGTILSWWRSSSISFCILSKIRKKRISC